jgi:polyhydroxyalkanoate synthesis regulator phasin
MPPARSSSGRSKTPRSGAAAARDGAKRSKQSPRAKSTTSSRSAAKADGLSGFIEQLVNRVIKPLDLVVISRERIQETLDEAAERGRVTRGDANELVAELVRRGRQQTDEVFKDLEGKLGRGRGQIGTATKQSMDRIARGADRARRSIGVGPSFPISAYDDLTAGQVDQRLGDLKPAELRRVRDYERRHANRKSVLEAIERALD